MSPDETRLGRADEPADVGSDQASGADAAASDAALEDAVRDDVAFMDVTIADVALEDVALEDAALDASMQPDTSVGDSGAVDAAPDVPPPPCGGPCDDGVGCTDDACEDDSCVFTPNDARCPMGMCDVLLGCVEERCRRDGDCDDGDFCNGSERCDRISGLCERGDPPSCADGVDCTDDRCEGGQCVRDSVDMRCDDGLACTRDRCDAETGCDHDPDDGACDDGIDCTDDHCDAATGCEHDPRDFRCGDGILCTEDACDPAFGCVFNPRDSLCFDLNACTFDLCVPGDGCRFTRDDRDNDGAPGSVPSGCGQTLDCNDADPLVFPGAPERCNRIDDDCDGLPEPRCLPGAIRRCNGCDDRYTGEQTCLDDGCSYSACGEFGFGPVNYDPGPDLGHGCGFDCGGGDWCVIGQSCSPIDAGMSQVVPPGAYELEILWGDRGTWTFRALADGVTVASETVTNEDASNFPRTVLRFVVPSCQVIDLRVSGTGRIRIYSVQLRRVGESTP